jgi:hypothetical protein
MNKPRINNGTVVQPGGRNWKGLEIRWSLARAQEVRIQKSVVRNRLLKALGLAMSMNVLETQS